MPTRTATPHLPRRGPLRSPLAAATQSPPPPPTCPPADTGPASSQPTAADPRSLTLAEFGDYLRTINNRDGRPYEDTTINAYVFPAKALDAWMTANSLDGDFTTVDTAMLNRYFREYYQTRGQGGTHTQQRNLIQLFNYLQREYGHPSPYTAGLNRYAEVRGRPKTLSPSFVDDLLEVTGSGKARDFETARDHAIIRILRSEGIRRQELLSMVMHTLPADLLRNPVFRLVPLKGARNAGEGRLVSLAPATARTLAVYLRARRSHELADSDWGGSGPGTEGALGTPDPQDARPARRRSRVRPGDAAPVPPYLQRRFRLRRLRRRPGSARSAHCPASGTPYTSTPPSPCRSASRPTQRSRCEPG
jgi:site-specific recombinase XerD